MKKIFIIAIISLGFASHPLAQQKPHSNYMVIAIFPTNETHYKFNMIVTREDTSQVQTPLEMPPHVKLKDFAATYESLILQTLKPYFDKGWKLVTSTIENEQVTGSAIVSGIGTDHVTRFYLSKDK